MGETMRRGLPRVPGGEAWPPGGAVGAAEATPAVAAAVADVPDAARQLRRGLPREAGGAPWPPETGAPAPAPSATEAAIQPTAVRTVATAQPGTVLLRRGLARVPGGEPWPPAGTMVASSAVQPAPPPAVPAETLRAETPSSLPPAAEAALPPTASVVPPAVAPPVRASRFRPTGRQVLAVLVAAAVLDLVVAGVVALARALVGAPFLASFFEAFPGAYSPAIAVAPGFEPWVGWQHFLNVFLMVLIIRSGLSVRAEKRPTVFWSPRRDPKRKVSLTVWFHQALDVLWLANGVIFVVLLFVSGHWVRIVPTSWAVFPNALSAALRYLSFDWPTENGWANYNSLQQLSYFAVVFLAAPLAAATGFRMSTLWPKKAERLSRLYRIEWARAVHFPVMVFFVVFIVVHVALVALTGLLRNLNHMYASQDTEAWTGFWLFTASLAVIALAWIAARPLVLAPIARLFGRVSGR